MWGSVPVGRQREISKWYGWQTILPLLLVDLNTVAVFATENKVFVYTGYLPWLPLHIASGSVVHLAHGRVGTSFLSLGLTTASTTLGWVAGLAFRGELITGAIGLLGMNIVDIAVLSREKKRVSVDKPRGAQLVLPSSIHLLPMLESNARGMSIVGMF